MKKRPRLLKFLRRLFVVSVCLVTLLFLLVAIENWRSKRAWDAYKKAAAKEDKALSFSAFVPPPVPDEQNFMMTPLLRPIFGETGGEYAERLQERFEFQRPEARTKRPGMGSWREARSTDLEKWREHVGSDDLDEVLARHSGAMEELAAAVRRPSSRAPLPYESGDLFLLALPHAQVLVTAGRCHFLRGAAALEKRHPDQAVADIETLLLLTESQNREPLLVLHLVGAVNFQLALQLIWEGQASHRFSDAQLALLQGHLERMAPLAGTVGALKAERAAITGHLEGLLGEPWAYDPALGIPAKTETLEQWSQSPPWKSKALARITPRSVVYRNLIWLNDWHDRLYLRWIDFDAHRVHPTELDAEEESLLVAAGRKNPNNMMAVAIMPTYGNIIRRTVDDQLGRDLAVVSCALERHRIANGAYPESLGALASRFSKDLPHDLITGEPLRYRRQDDGYVLYSVGWDENNDGGKAMERNDNKEGGDVVWAIRGNR